MSGPSTITRRHLERLAVVYVRQSTLTQVREHTESTARQYALAEEAERLGWATSQIVTIDADLGLSGRSASGRVGFKELVSRVCLGEVGAVFGLEISRLARSSADLQRLLEFCSLSDTLIVAADGLCLRRCGAPGPGSPRGDSRGRGRCLLGVCGDRLGLWGRRLLSAAALPAASLRGGLGRRDSVGPPDPRSGRDSALQSRVRRCLRLRALPFP